MWAKLAKCEESDPTIFMYTEQEKSNQISDWALPLKSVIYMTVDNSFSLYTPPLLSRAFHKNVRTAQSLFSAFLVVIW